MCQEQIESRSLTPGVQASWHLYTEALLGIVRAAASHAVVVGELRVASIQTPAIPTTLDGLRLGSVAETLAAEKLLLRALVSVI